MVYVELKCAINPEKPEIIEQLMAILAELGFESFVEGEDEILAYIQAHNYNSSLLKNELLTPEITESTKFSVVEIPDQNWNAVWEENFQSVTIDQRCHIRAPFHPENHEVEFELIIEPKMSFGTAHHETTALMIRFLLELDVNNKKVLDMGCGTGVLAILAAKKGSNDITAIDNDEWAYNNTLENIQRNNTPSLDVHLGDASLLENLSFDVILANINRNILLNDIPVYSKSLNNNGILLLSGFYIDDLDAIKNRALTSGLSYLSHKEDNRWVAARFVKMSG